MTDFVLINFIIILLAIGLCCVILVLIIRSILSLVIYVSYKKYLKLKETAQKILPQSKKNFIKEDEELSRKKDEIPKAHSQVKADNINAKNQQKFQILNENKKSQEDEKIVGVAPTIGFWTQKIFGERIAVIMAQAESMKKGESTKFWQNFIKASRSQDRFAGKSK
jgi:hypothetical protein